MSVSMHTTTTTQLLEALFGPGEEAVWREFDARYRPIIFAFARELGVAAEDAADVAQETLTDFLRDYRAGKYDRRRGRLRSWIIGIARHRVLDTLRQRARNQATRGESAFDELPDDARLTAIWDAEHERSILERAMTELRERTRTDPKTIRVFELVALEEVPAQTVAEDHGITLAEVYRTKNRVTKRLREIVGRLTTMYADEG